MTLLYKRILNAALIMPVVFALVACGGGGSGGGSSTAATSTPPSAAAQAPPPVSPPPPPPPAVASASAVVPASAVAPWFVQVRVNALSFSSRQGLTTVWGDYFENSEDPTYVLGDGQTQELSNAANGNHAVYTKQDLGSGIESVMLRVSLPAGSSSVEIRMDSVSGPLAGPVCAIPSTGGAGKYRTISCAVNSAVAKGAERTLVFRFTGTTPELRFNWFGYWARDTIQQIDKLSKAQGDGSINVATPTTPQAGTAARGAQLLPAANVPLARTFGKWSPSKIGDCPKWLHDTYWVQGDDGKAYPTWHPAAVYNPETGAYCTFGHEHGSDPRGSESFAVVGMPTFGIVSENHEPNRPDFQRIEDHFGYKVIVGNRFRFVGVSNEADQRLCNFVITLHVGTHSPDAFTNSAHEVIQAGECQGFQSFVTRYFALFGIAGEFKEAETQGCGLTVNPGVAPMPANQPTFGVHRAIPTRDCFLRGPSQEQAEYVDRRLTEFWLTTLSGGNFYYTIGNPSRFYDQTAANKAGRILDLCYVAGHPLAATLRCQETVAASQAKVPWDDPRSSFRGTVHTNTHLSGIAFGNSTSRTVYTNAWGQNSSTSPDPSKGVIFKQTVPTTGFALKVAGLSSVVPNVDHSAGGRNGVRSPN